MATVWPSFDAIRSLNRAIRQVDDSKIPSCGMLGSVEGDDEMAKVKWDIDVLRSSINTLNTEKNNLRAQRDQMKAAQSRVDVNWKSPAGQQYQNRLQNDMTVLDNILTQLDKRLNSLNKALGFYNTCENKVVTALRRLP